jgi:hypothetical protein
MTDSECDIDFLARGIVDGFTMPPSRWVALYSSMGCGILPSALPKHHRHLVADFRETRQEMLSRSK